MAIVVAGGGAIGLMMAGQLAHAGQAVALLARPRTVEQLRQQPLRIQAGKHSLHVALPHVAPSPAELPPAFHAPDLAIVCVKSYDTEALIPSLHDISPRQVLSLQNGVGNEEQLAAQFGAERVLAGVVTSSVQQMAPDTLTITRRGGIGIADLRLTDELPRAAAWAMQLRTPTNDVTYYPDYRAMKWSKLLLNMLANAIPAILDLPVATVYRRADLVALEQRALLEAVQVMTRSGFGPVNLPSYPVTRLVWAMQSLPMPVLRPLLQRVVGGGRGGKQPSLHQDLLRGRTRTEGDYLYGAVVAAAPPVQSSVPVNTILWQTLRDIASGVQDWSHYRQQPQRLCEAIANGTTTGATSPA